MAQTIDLADGTRLLVRPLEHGERAAVEAVFAGLGDRSRMLRFGGAKTSLSERDLDALTAVDHQTHEALVALEEKSRRPVAVARFVRDAAEPHTAEVAFAVVDEWHGRGLGTRLTRLLACRALALGVERFRASVVVGNSRASALLRRLGDVVRTGFDGSSAELEVALGGCGCNGGVAARPLAA